MNETPLNLAQTKLDAARDEYFSAQARLMEAVRHYEETARTWACERYLAGFRDGGDNVARIYAPMPDCSGVEMMPVEDAR